MVIHRTHLAVPRNGGLRTLYCTLLFVASVCVFFLISETVISRTARVGILNFIPNKGQDHRHVETREMQSLSKEHNRSKNSIAELDTDNDDEKAKEVRSSLPFCLDSPPKVVNQKVTVNATPVDYFTLKKELGLYFQYGGSHSPTGCRARDRTAIIIPYRNRRKNLLILLHNLLPFLIRQQMDFRVFIVEQVEQYPFNRCLMFNAGFKEILRLGNFSCFIVQDTDLVPRDNRNLYRCDVKPRHFVISRSNKPFNGLPYPTYIGGVLAVRRHHMEAVNGCSNIYYGWGFEDDDLYRRFQLKNMTPVRYQRAGIGEYEALDHGIQPRNHHKKELLGTVPERMASDGLNSLKYWVEDFELRELYTWILVRPPPPPALYNDTNANAVPEATKRKSSSKKS